MSWTAIECRSNGTRWAVRYDEATWNSRRPELERLHLEGLSRPMMLQRLEGTGFTPSIAQLNRRMSKWGYGALEVRSNDSITPNSHNSTPKEVETNVWNIQQMRSESPPNTMSQSSTTPSDQSVETPNEVSKFDQLAITEPQRCTGVPPTTYSLTFSLSELYISPFTVSSFLSRSYCHHERQYPKQMLIASILAYLKCFKEAEQILEAALVPLENDMSVPKCIKLLIHVNLYRVRTDGKGKKPLEFAAFLNEDSTMSPYIRETLKTGENSRPNAVKYLSLLSHFRMYDDIVHSHSTGSYTQYQLSNQILQWEMSTRLLQRLMLWCLSSLTGERLLIGLAKTSLKQYNSALSNTTTVQHRFEVTQLLACHLLTKWIHKPNLSILWTMRELQEKSKSIIIIDTMLPEMLITIVHMLSQRVDANPSKNFPWFIDLRSYRSELRQMCSLSPTAYCIEFVETMISHFASPPTSTAIIGGCGERAVTQLAEQILGSAISDKASSKSQNLWLKPSHDVSTLSQYTQLQMISEGEVAGVSQEYKQTKLVAATSLHKDTKSQPASMGSFTDTGFQATEVVEKVSHSPSMGPCLLRRTSSVHRGRPNRAISNSTGKMSLDSFKALNSRIEAEKTANAEGVSRFSSRASKMSLDSDFSFRCVTGYETSSIHDVPNHYDRDTAFVDVRPDNDPPTESFQTSSTLHIANSIHNPVEAIPSGTCELPGSTPFMV